MRYQNLMRIRRKRNRRSWTPETSRLAHLAKARRRRERPDETAPLRPAIGLLRHTVRVENHLDGTGFEIRLLQGERLNQVVAETFGRRSKPHGLDFLLRKLRRRLLVNWLRGV